MTVKEAADIREAGEKTATLEVVFKDGSTKEVKVAVVVEEDVTDAIKSGLEIGDEIAGESVGSGEEATENNETAEFILEVLQTEEGKLLKADEEPYETNSKENVLGGIQGINEEDIDVIKNIKFNVYVMENGSPKLEKEGVVPELGDKDRWSGAFYIRGLEKGKKYIFQVDPDSIPEGYHYYFTDGSSYPHPYKTMDPKFGGALAEFDSSDTEEGKKYGHARLHLDVLDIIFAKNEETAKNILHDCLANKQRRVARQVLFL